MFAEILCLAMTIYFEARNQPIDGQIAVAHVVMNRVASEVYPDTPCEVMKDGGEKRDQCQFSFWCDGKDERIRDGRAWNRAIETATFVIGGILPDPSDGATHYHAISVEPNWACKIDYKGQIGQHHFYRERRWHQYTVRVNPEYCK